MKDIVIGILLLFISCSSQEKQVDETVIPVATAVGTGKILNLSDYAESVTYIPLETTDSLLIAAIGTVLSIGDNYLISDSPRGRASRYHLFDKSGKHIIQIGSIGHGPGQYTSVRSVDVDYQSKKILLDAMPKCFEYNWDGVLVDEKAKIDSVGYHPFQTMYMADNLYLSTISTPNVREYKAFLYQKSDAGLKIVRTYPNNYQREKIGFMKGGYGTTDGKIYRYKDQIRYWRSWDDTIFTFDRNQDIQIAYRFDLGKYRAPIEWMSSYREDYDITNYVYPQSIKESDRYLFLSFACGRNAPEKFEYVQEGTTPMGRQKQSLVNVSVYGLFDKQTSDFVLLNQPIKHKELGFRNDLDGGPVFWPKYISPDEKMITWWSADQFLEIYESLPNPSTELREVAENLKPDDNPVLMVVQLK